MLDENLPTFFLKPSSGKIKHHESVCFTQNGSDPDPQYSLHHLDPASDDAKNTYAAALFDSHNPQILYGEVLAKPGWSHPTLSQEEIRRNGGVPPPQPIFPTEFAIQLYSPDLQVLVRQQIAKWSGTVTWNFSLPQTTFRMPSSSDLDRVQSDPSADVNTPHVNFLWKKEGRKDLTCYMTGKSTDPTGKKAKKTKDPDIAVAMFSGFKELTILESNLYRVEVEDYKGLEVALLIGAAVIRDLFFSDLAEQFHITDVALRKNNGGTRARNGSNPLEGPNFTPPVMTPPPPPPPAYTGPSQHPREKVSLHPSQGARINASISSHHYARNTVSQKSSTPPLTTNHNRTYHSQPQSQPRSSSQGINHQQPLVPPSRHDPRTQWEIDTETARLKVQVEEEEDRERKRQEDNRRKARRRREIEEEQKTRRFLEQEAKQEARQKEKKLAEWRKKQAIVDKETDRLRKQYGDQSSLLRPTPPQSNRHSYSAPLQTYSGWHTQQPFPQTSRPTPSPVQPPRMQTPLLSNGLLQPQIQPKAKKSFWSLKPQGENSTEKVKKKKSSMF